MQLFIGNDHAAVGLKTYVVDFLKTEFPEIEVINYGTDTDDSVDYPDYGAKVAQSVANNPKNLGIVICGTGIGISIAANKIKGVRAAKCNNALEATLSRQHNDANVLAMGARMIGRELALNIVKAFLEGEFAGGRHQQRVDKITKLED